MALMIVLVALPTGVYFYHFIQATMKASVADRHQKVATQLANDALSDYFRQFSQNAYSGHYDSTLARPKEFYSAGFSTVTYIPDQIHHSVYVKATGAYGTSGKTERTRVLEATIAFQSNLVKYGTMFNASETVNAAGTQYNGGFYVNGSLTVGAGNIVFEGGPVVINGSFTGFGDTIIDGDLFYSGGSVTGVTVNGTTYNYIPQVSWPTLDFTYYNANATYVTAANQTIIFNSTQTFTVVGGATYAIPATGAIIYANEANLTVSGVVSGPVTVVAGSATNGNCASAAGKITVNNNLYYVNASSNAASANGSFAALATNCMTFSKAGADMDVVGVYFVQNGTTNMSATGSAGRTFHLYGVRTQLMTLTGFSRSTLSFDTNLRSYQPPGLPEIAYLVNYNLHH